MILEPWFLSRGSRPCQESQVVVIPTQREWLVSTTGFLGLRSRPACCRQARLYHLHPCRRAFAGMTRGWIPAFARDIQAAVRPWPVYFAVQPAWSRKRAMVRVTAAMPAMKPTIHLVWVFSD